MSHLERLRARLAEDSIVTVAHPLDDAVTMRHRPPTPEHRDRAMKGRPRDAASLVPAMAGLLADTIVDIREGDDVIAEAYGMDLAGSLGIEWVQGETRAVDVVTAFYGDAWDALIAHGNKVLRAAAGRVDPSS